MSKKKIYSAKWVLPISDSPIENGAVVIDKHKIVDVGTRKEIKKKYPDVDIEAHPHSVILPGFVDLHTHLEYSIFRGVCDDLDFSKWKLQVALKSKELNEHEWQVSSNLGALEAVQAGITTIADITYSGNSLDAAVEASLRGRVFFEITGMDRRKTDEIIKAGRSSVDSLREIAKGTKIDVGISPHSPYTVCPPLYKTVSEWAIDEKMQLCTHLAGSKDEYQFVKYGSSALAGSYREIMGWSDLLWHPTGTSPVKYLEQWGVFKSDILAVHCVHVDEFDLDVLQKNDVAIVNCPKCNAKLGMGIAPMKEFRDRGFRLGLGTDSPSSSNSMDMFDEMRIALFLQRGITQSAEHSPAEAFVKMATIGGAKALRIDNKVGTLEPGKEADMIIVDLSHSHQEIVVDPYAALVYSVNQENVILSMVGGEVIYKDYDFLTLDEEEIIDLSEPVRHKLKKLS